MSENYCIKDVGCVMRISVKVGSSLVIGLSDIIDKNYIGDFLDNFIQSLTNEFKYSDLNNWDLIFELVFNGGIPDIRIYHRQNSDPKRKQKYVTIHVPIPNILQVAWGVETRDIIVLKSPVGAEKWYRSIPCDLDSSTIDIHCCMAARAGIIHALTTGITIAGKRVALS